MSFVCPTERVSAITDSASNESGDDQGQQAMENGELPNGKTSYTFTKPSSCDYPINLGLRLVSFALILTAFLIVVTATQKITETMGMVQIHATASWTEDHTSVFYVYTMVIIFPYLFSTSVIKGLIVYRKSTPKARLLWTITVFDLLMAFLLMSSISASAAIGMVARNGSPKEQWQPVCNETEHYCDVAGVGFIISGIGFLGLFMIIVLDILILYKHPRRKSIPPTN